MLHKYRKGIKKTNVMSRNRSVPHNEHPYQFSPSVKKNAAEFVHTPRRGLIAALTSSELHSTPMAVDVSATGKRTIYPVDDDNVSKNYSTTNPFSNEPKEFKELDSLSEEMVQKLSSRKQRSYQHRQNKKRNRKRTAAITLTQRSSIRPTVVVNNVSVQTDPSITGIHRPPEFVGDGKKSNGINKFSDLSTILPTSEWSYSNKKYAAADGFLAQFMPESLEILASLMIMTILIFWLTSIILEVEVPSDIFQMASNYVRSFKWSYYSKQPQTNAEKFLEYLTKMFS